jgi:hypothetical protein
MSDRERTPDAERTTRNKGLQETEKRQHDPDKRTPHRAVEKDAPEQEHAVTPDEKSDQDMAHLENPPQSDGPRERSNNGV